MGNCFVLWWNWGIVNYMLKQIMLYQCDHFTKFMILFVNKDSVEQTQWQLHFYFQFNVFTQNLRIHQSFLLMIVVLNLHQKSCFTSKLTYYKNLRRHWCTLKNNIITHKLSVNMKLTKPHRNSNIKIDLKKLTHIKIEDLHRIYNNVLYKFCM